LEILEDLEILVFREQIERWRGLLSAARPLKISPLTAVIAVPS
jgi:hypothetical protein